MPDEPTTLEGPTPTTVQEQEDELNFDGPQPPAAQAPAPAATETPPATPPAQTPPEEEPPPWGERTIEEVWEALRNEQTVRGRLANELGTTRQQLESVQQAVRAPETPDEDAEREALRNVTPEQLEQIADEHGIGAALRVQEARLQVLNEDRLGPVFANVHENAATQFMSRLQSEFGDEVLNRHRQRLAERLDADEEYFVDPERRSVAYDRLREALLAAEFDFQRNPQGAPPPNPASSQTGERTTTTAFVERGSTPPPPEAPPQTAEEALKAEIDGAAPGKDLFGARPGEPRRL